MLVSPLKSIQECHLTIFKILFLSLHPDTVPGQIAILALSLLIHRPLQSCHPPNYSRAHHLSNAPYHAFDLSPQDSP
jgi:hypothetical protein